VSSKTPRRTPAFVQRLEALASLDRIHRPKESLVYERANLAARDQLGERLLDQLVAGLDPVSNSLRQTKKPPLMRTSEQLMSSTLVTVPSGSVWTR
jgi:hypothetical protein